MLTNALFPSKSYLGDTDHTGLETTQSNINLRNSSSSGVNGTPRDRPGHTGAAGAGGSFAATGREQAACSGQRNSPFWGQEFP